MTENINKQFQDLCRNGKLEEAKLLYSNYPTINISAYYECAFRGACFNGHLNIAKWLLKIKPTINISAENEYAFKSACSKGHLKVAGEKMT